MMIQVWMMFWSWWYKSGQMFRLWWYNSEQMFRLWWYKSEQIWWATPISDTANTSTVCRLRAGFYQKKLLEGEIFPRGVFLKANSTYIFCKCSDNQTSGGFSRVSKSFMPQIDAFRIFASLYCNDYTALL